jgi:uncharacterized protein (DUF2252 family)
MTISATPLSHADRQALGLRARKQLARSAHADFRLTACTHDPLAILRASMRGRVSHLVAIKYQRMVASPFGFFRGAVPIMAADLACHPNTGIATQLCGDAHVLNLGAFAAPDGRLVFDINDFDETIHAPFEWDVKRLATSLILAGREAGAKKSHCHDAAHTFLERYRAMTHTFARMAVLDLARYQVHRLHSVEPVSHMLSMAERATPQHSLEVLTVPVARAHSARTASSELQPRTGAHTRIFKTAPPNLTRIHGETARQVIDSLATYAESLQPERQHFLAQYTPLDVAFKIVGTGSVGLRDYCIYLQGNGPEDPLFLQIKEEALSAYAPYLGQATSPSHQGRRVVEGQRAMQFQSDPLLGWTTIQGRDFLVRQLNDHKAAIAPTDLKSASLLEYAAVCGETLARGHARSNDSCMVAGYIGRSTRFDDAIVKFAADYANQTERDWEALLHSRHQAKPSTKPAGKPKTAGNLSAKLVTIDAVPAKSTGKRKKAGRK